MIKQLSCLPLSEILDLKTYNIIDYTSFGLSKEEHSKIAMEKEHKPYWTEARYIGDGEWEDHLGDPLVITYYKILDWIPKPLEK